MRRDPRAIAALKPLDRIDATDHAKPLEALAYGLFAFWNNVKDEKLWSWKGGVHAFHEVTWPASKARQVPDQFNM